MTARLVLTAAGAAAMADGANVGTRAVTFTRLALGSGTGMGDRSAQMALESQQDIVAVAGSNAVPGRIPIRGDFMPTQTYAATEVGLFARIGEDGAEFLAAYWIAEDAAGAFAGAAAGTALIVAGVVEIVASAADINIAPAVNISIGVPPDVIRESDHATVDRRGIIRLATEILARAGENADRAITPATLAAVLAAYPTNAALATALAAIDLSEYATIAGVNQALGGFVPRAGGTFTGPVRGPTPAAGDNSTLLATTAWIRAFFGDASSRSWTVAGTYNYSWEWDTPTALLVLVGGGGGGASASARTADLPADGADSIAAVTRGARVVADGGARGAPIRRDTFSSPRDVAGNGGQSDVDFGTPGYGGETVTRMLTGLARGTVITITVGAGGARGRRNPPPQPDNNNGATNGSPGWAVLVPLF